MFKPNNPAFSVVFCASGTVLVQRALPARLTQRLQKQSLLSAVIKVYAFVFFAVNNCLAFSCCGMANTKPSLTLSA